MLFNSYEFIFLFLPTTFFCFFLIAKISPSNALLTMLMASILFYCGWSYEYSWLLLASIVFNYFMGLAISKVHTKRTLLWVGILANLVTLGYFKYSIFLTENINILLGNEIISSKNIIIPLGVSFYTFTQIAFLVDVYYGLVKEYKFTHYALFVTYFPHLIAGPILHHKEMMPQFSNPSTYRPQYTSIAIGLTFFAFGLFKKVVLADGISPYASPIFDAQNISVTLIEAWVGALAYAFQLYFDFSGYSDMAIGISKMFGIDLPFNFNSPYQATSIIDFWRRWHMTLSRFLRDYIYIPLGGNRNGKLRRYSNLFTTMLLGGLWHGAGWTFVAWGALHGIYLAINHAWHFLCDKHLTSINFQSLVYRELGRVLTFTAVVIGWVFFRAHDIGAATEIVRGMLGLNGASISAAMYIYPNLKIVLLWIASLWGITFFCPNTQTLILRNQNQNAPCPTKLKYITQFTAWSPTTSWAIITAAIAVIALSNISQLSPFLYFQF